MKTYVPEPEKWSEYFTQKANRKAQVVEITQPVNRVIPIETARKGTTQDKALVKIEAITPVQRTQEMAKAELPRIRKHAFTSDGESEQAGASGFEHVSHKKRRTDSIDSTGF